MALLQSRQQQLEVLRVVEELKTQLSGLKVSLPMYLFTASDFLLDSVLDTKTTCVQ